MIKPLWDFARRHIILFGTAKFAAGLVIGSAVGVYFLPFLTEEKRLDTAALAQLEASAEWSGTFAGHLRGFDAFHWGEGTVRASDTRIWLEGKISPGPDYRLCLTPSLATDEASLLKIGDQSVQVGEVKAFSNFSLDVPPGITIGDYPAVLTVVRGIRRFNYRSRAELRLAVPLGWAPSILISVGSG